jgi:hypothetical protein
VNGIDTHSKFVVACELRRPGRPHIVLDDWERGQGLPDRPRVVATLAGFTAVKFFVGFFLPPGFY